jgi:L-asparaginase/Glu-tRNA(Gln) amidotransferase subunit D
LADARRNVLVSIGLAGRLNLPEVCVFFNEHLFRGNRVVKQSTSSIDAFASPNFEHLAKIGSHLTLQKNEFRKHPRGPLTVHKNLQTKISVIRLVPGFDDFHIEQLARSVPEGERCALVLMLYGTGGAPSKKEKMYAAIKAAIDRGLIVVACTQTFSHNIRPFVCLDASCI